MQKLSTKILLLLVIVVAINQLVFSFIKLPFSWGNLYEKEYCLEKDASYYNTILLGSSRIYRQVNPALFDSLNNQVGYHTSTFNFGRDGMTIPEAYYQFENILKIPNLKAKYIIVELCDVDTFADMNLHTTGKKHYYSVEAWWNSVSTLVYSSYSAYRIVAACSIHTLNYFETLLNFNLLAEIIKFKSTDKYYTTLKCGNSYSPLNINDTSSVFSHLRLNFLKDSDELKILESYNNQLFEFHSSHSEKSSVNNQYLQLVKKMIDQGVMRDIKVIFFLPPRLQKIHCQNVLPIYSMIPAQNRIELANPKKYSIYYRFKYSFDLGHLDTEGSILFTQDIAKQFQQINQP